MKTRTGTVIVSILAVLGAIAGFFGSSGYLGFQGTMTGFRAACHALDTAETKQVITKAQRAEIAKMVIRSGKPDAAGEADIVRYVSGDCSKSFMDEMMSSMKR
jgi:hypothetical protein